MQTISIIFAATVLTLQFFIIFKLKKMNKDVQALIDAVALETSLENSLITLFNTFLAQVQAGIDAEDLTAIQNTVTAVKQNQAALNAAIVAGTPAQSVPTAPGNGGTGTTPPPATTPPATTPPPATGDGSTPPATTPPPPATGDGSTPPPATGSGG